METGVGLTLLSVPTVYDFSSVNGAEPTGYPLSFRMARIGLFRAGFRHQKPEGGLMYRLGVLARISKDDFAPYSTVPLFDRIWPSLSLGYGF